MQTFSRAFHPAATGMAQELLTQGTIKSLVVSRCPHGWQTLEIEPTDARKSAQWRGFMRPGMKFEWEEPTPMTLRTSFATALLVDWDVELIINPDWNSLNERPGRVTQWFPLPEIRLVGGGSAIIVEDFVPTLSGTARIRWYCTGVSGVTTANLYPYDCTTPRTFPMGGVTTLQNSASGEQRLRPDADTDREFMGVVAGCNYALAIDPTAVGAMDWSIDIGVEEDVL